MVVGGRSASGTWLSALLNLQAILTVTRVLARVSQQMTIWERRPAIRQCADRLRVLDARHRPLPSEPVFHQGGFDE